MPKPSELDPCPHCQRGLLACMRSRRTVGRCCSACASHPGEAPAPARVMPS